MKRSNTFWGTAPTSSTEPLDVEKMVEETADGFVSACAGNLESAFMYAWAIAQNLEKRFKESPEQEALKAKEQERCQQALAEFALGSILKEHNRLHRAAIQYAEKLGMLFPPKR